MCMAEALELYSLINCSLQSQHEGLVAILCELFQPACDPTLMMIMGAS